MKNIYKIYTVIILGLITIALLYILDSKTKQQFESHRKVITIYHNLFTLDLKISYEVLNTSAFLYYDNDIIANKLNELNSAIKGSLSDEYLKGSRYSNSQKILLELQKEAEEQNRDIYRFLSFNNAIKNSLVIIPTLSERASGIFHIKEKKDTEFLLLLNRVQSLIAMSKNGFDLDFMTSLSNSYKQLSSYKFKLKQKKSFQKKLLAHINLFNRFFPSYQKNLTKILNNPMHTIIQESLEQYNREAKSAQSALTVFSIAMEVLFILAILLIVYFLVLTERENQRLKKLQKSLHKAATTDALTGLFNRHMFDEHQSSIKSPNLILLNIDHFKNFNDFYGTTVGDFLLIESARLLKNTVPSTNNAKLYRLGADDFGVLFEEESIENAQHLSEFISQSFAAHTFRYNDFELYISVSTALSNERPLLETADMALKYIKKDYTTSTIIYSDALSLQDSIEQNLHTVRLIDESLEDNKIYPYFQAIVDSKTGKISKYECLVRLERKDGTILTPFFFLDVATESKSYQQISIQMIIKSIEMFADRDEHFSINLSMQDIANPNITETIREYLNKYPKVAKRMILELLESEGVEDYEQVYRFITEMKTLGCQIAIDDFGSGYSNFLHIAKLNVDYLKIDGSLIKYIADDDQIYSIVKTIVQFAHDSRLKTIAEFVENEKIYKLVKELGIDFSQGYYFSKPSAKLIS